MAILKDSKKLILLFFILRPSGENPHFSRQFLWNGSFFDLRQIIPATKYQNGGLANLTRQILGRKLNKDYRVRCSNWEAEVLSEQQKTYAADDAVCALQVELSYISAYSMKIWEEMKGKIKVLFRF